MSMKRAIIGITFGLASQLLLVYIGADLSEIFIGGMVGYLFGADGVGERE